MWVVWTDTQGVKYLSIFTEKPNLKPMSQTLSKIIHVVEMSPCHVGLTYEQLKEKYPLPEEKSIEKTDRRGEKSD